MDTVIGLGAAGCNIADCFKKYPQYAIYKIDTDLEEDENNYTVTERSNPEDYERHCPDLTNFLQHINGDVLFVVAGGGFISGMSLQVLKHLKNCNINVLYIKPNDNDLSRIGFLQEKLTRNVFQEYARSGLFNILYLVSNEDLENMLGEVPILEYNNKLNEYLAGMIHWINVFKNTEPVLDNYSDPRQNSRIATFGVLDIPKGEESFLYELDNLTDKCYYFAINETTLKTDGKLLRNIRELTSTNEIRASYEVHSTKYPQSFCYFIAYTNISGN